METGGDGVVESVDAASPADAAGLRALPCVANFIELIFQQFRRDAHRSCDKPQPSGIEAA